MQTLKAAIIGTGLRHGKGGTGFGMSHQHVSGLKQAEGVELVALCDLKPELAEAFRQEHGGQRIYSDYHEMLEREKPDIVCIATWPHLHGEMLIAAAQAGAKGVYCEKPMARTFGEAQRMIEAGKKHNTLLAFNHQRRFDPAYVACKQLIQSGAIGKLQRLEMSTANLFDWGTHWFDMMFFYNDETPAEWVIGQIDLRGTRRVFDAPCEGQGLCHVKFANDVRGFMVTGHDAKLGFQHRITGTDGILEIGADGWDTVRTWYKGQSQWTNLPVTALPPERDAVALGVLDFIDALRTGREPQLGGDRALRATELIFATYESSRRRARIDLPLDISDSPLADLLEKNPPPPPAPKST
jgi:predicted dehydrogenase